MQYTEVIFQECAEGDWRWEMLMQQLADIGFDMFDGQKAYIQTRLYDKDALYSLAKQTGLTILNVNQCDDTNWNSEWEGNRNIIKLPYNIEIQPDGAFGSGSHITTSLMLLAIDAEGDKLAGSKVLDMGSGTGVLSIMAAKKGAAHITAIDIDTAAVESTKRNAERNNIPQGLINALLGDKIPEEMFDYIFANIHRNVLISMMPVFKQHLNPQGRLLISGFFKQDIPSLTQSARQNGLTLYSQDSNNLKDNLPIEQNQDYSEEWSMLAFQNTAL